MKKTFVEKSPVKIFLGTVLAAAAVSVLFVSCKEKNSQKTAHKNQEKKVPKSLPVPETKVDPENIPEHSDRRIIYLTFDDGPNKGTDNLLKIIHERKVPVTSFVVGNHVYGSKAQKKQLENLKNDSLVELANHSYSHAENRYSEFYKNSEKVVKDFNRVKDSLKFSNSYARTPGRNIWRTSNINETDLKSSKAAADELSRNGYKLIGWDLEWKPDQKMKLKGSHKEMLKKVDSIFLNDLEKNSRHLVFLSHDQYLTDDESVKELSLFIQELQKTNRFEFRKLSSYPKIDALLQ